jgi:hypothetical protein
MVCGRDVYGFGWGNLKERLRNRWDDEFKMDI